MANTSDSKQLTHALLPNGGDGFKKKHHMPLAWRATWTGVLWLTLVGVGVGLSMLGPTLESMTSQLRISSALASTLFSYRGAGYCIGALAFGQISHRISNTGSIFLWATATVALGAWVLVTVETYAVAAAIMVAQGLAFGLQDAGGNVMILNLWRGTRYQNAFEHAFHFFFGVGASAAPLGVRWLLQTGAQAFTGWRFLSYSMMLPLIGFLVITIACPPTLLTDEEEPDSAKNASGSNMVKITGFFLFIYVGIESSFGGYIDMFSVRWLHETPMQGASLTSVYWCALCVGRGVASLVTPFVHHTRYLFMHIVLAVVSISAFWFVAEQPLETISPDSAGWTWGVVTPVALFGFALAPIFPGVMLMIEELLGRGLPAKDSSFLVFAAVVGEMVIPLTVGLLFSVNPLSFCWSQAVLVAGTTLVFLLLGGRLLGAQGSPKH